MKTNLFIAFLLLTSFFHFVKNQTTDFKIFQEEFIKSGKIPENQKHICSSKKFKNLVVGALLGTFLITVIFPPALFAAPGLYGAAATSSGLAALGGGSLAVGGGGMAAGQAVLGTVGSAGGIIGSTAFMDCDLPNKYYDKIFINNALVFEGIFHGNKPVSGKFLYSGKYVKVDSE